MVVLRGDWSVGVKGQVVPNVRLGGRPDIVDRTGSGLSPSGSSLPLTRGQPFLQRTLALGRGLSSQQIGHTNVFLEIRPVNATAAGDQSPTLAFPGGGMHQTGIPSQGRNDGPSVSQIDGQAIVSDDNLSRHAQFRVSR